MNNTKLLLYFILVCGFLALCGNARVVEEDSEDLSLENDRRVLLEDRLRAIANKRNTLCYDNRPINYRIPDGNLCTSDARCCSGSCRIDECIDYNDGNGLVPSGVCIPQEKRRGMYRRDENPCK